MLLKRFAAGVPERCAFGFQSFNLAIAGYTEGQQTPTSTQQLDEYVDGLVFKGQVAPLLRVIPAERGYTASRPSNRPRTVCSGTNRRLGSGEEVVLTACISLLGLAECHWDREALLAAA